MPAFDDDQIKSITGLFDKLAENLREQAGSDYSRNDAAREALHGAAYAVDGIDVIWELKHREDNSSANPEG